MTVKRVAKIVGLLVLLLVVAIGGLLAATFMGLKSVEDGLEINGVRMVLDGYVTVGVVPVGEGRVALVDAGNDATGGPILAELSRRQLGPDAVVAIFVTHGHPDHIAAVKQFPKAHLMALEAEVPMVEGRAGSHGPLTRLFPVSPTGLTVSRTLQDGEIVAVGDATFRVFAVPGHTAGSAAYLVKGVLFVGDSANADRDGNLVAAPWIFSDSQSRNRSALLQLGERLARERVDVKAIAPAHSGVLTDGLESLRRFVIGYQ